MAVPTSSTFPLSRSSTRECSDQVSVGANNHTVAGAFDVPGLLPLVEMTIAELGEALTAGVVTAETLVAAYLERIAHFDRDGPRINSVPVLNPDALDDARRSDAERAAGKSRGPLHGLPFVVKDSFSVRGLTVASGSPAFEHLRATRDAFTVERLREAGAIVLGKTTMAPMAAGGMQRGLYGRAESPFNGDYLPAAWFSGSSNGSGAALGAGFAAFALAAETLSSGRSPASNNGLVAYTPSRGVLSIRGNWPFLAVRDVVVPFARTVADLLLILDALVADDPDTSNDLWRSQPWVPLPDPSQVRPGTYLSLADRDALRGKILAVPGQLIGELPVTGEQFVLAEGVRELWRRTVNDLETLGARVFVTDIPAFTEYEGWSVDARGPEERGYVPQGFLSIETRQLVASGWDEFLRKNDDSNLGRLELVDPDLIFPTHLRGFGPDLNPLPPHDWHAVVEFARGGVRPSLATPGLERALTGIERFRRELLDEWLAKQGVDLITFPAATGVGPSNADYSPSACRAAWRRGVEHSTGGFTVRHLGLPTVTVTMGAMHDTGMPLGVTFASTAYRDNDVIAAAYAFDNLRDRRAVPRRTPPLRGRG